MNKENENKNAEISARIAKVLQYTGETRNGFAVNLGYERAQTVYDIMNMKSAPSYDFFHRFSISEYSDIIDMRWLLSGRGSMLRTESPQCPIEPVSTSTDAMVIRLMDKLDDKEAKIDHLQSELRSMEKELATLKALHSQSQEKEPEHHSDVNKATETFISDLSGGYGEGCLHTNQPIISSGKSSVGKI